MVYWLVKTGNDGERGIDGGLMKKSNNLPAMRNVIDVTSIEEYSEKVSSKGGKLLMPKTEIPGVGFFALFEDMEGNVFGMMQENRKNN